MFCEVPNVDTVATETLKKKKKAVLKQDQEVGGSLFVSPCQSWLTQQALSPGQPHFRLQKLKVAQ